MRLPLQLSKERLTQCPHRFEPIVQCSTEDIIGVGFVEQTSSAHKVGVSIGDFVPESRAWRAQQHCINLRTGLILREVGTRACV